MRWPFDPREVDFVFKVASEAKALPDWMHTSFQTFYRDRQRRTRVETEQALRSRLSRALLMQGAFHTAGIMLRHSADGVVCALQRLQRDLRNRGDDRAVAIGRIYKQFIAFWRLVAGL